LIPIEAVGAGLLGLGLPLERGFEVAGDDGVDLAEAALADEFGGPGVDGDGALLGAGLEDAAVAGDGAGEVAALGDGEGEGLFGVDVEAGLEGVGGDEDTGVGGGFDEDGVEFLLIEHAAVVGVAPGAGEGGFEAGRLVEAGGVAIGEGGDVGLGELFVLEQPFGATAEAD